MKKFCDICKERPYGKLYRVDRPMIFLHILRIGNKYPMVCTNCRRRFMPTKRSPAPITKVLNNGIN